MPTPLGPALHSAPCQRFPWHPSKKDALPPPSPNIQHCFPTRREHCDEASPWVVPERLRTQRRHSRSLPLSPERSRAAVSSCDCFSCRKFSTSFHSRRRIISNCSGKGRDEGHECAGRVPPRRWALSSRAKHKLGHRNQIGLGPAAGGFLTVPDPEELEPCGEGRAVAGRDFTAASIQPTSK